MLLRQLDNRSMWIVCLVFNALIFSTPMASAALSSDASAAISFYRSRLSPFPSGQSSRLQLEKNLLRSENDLLFRTRWNHKEYSLRSSQMLRSIQVAKTVDLRVATSLYNSPDVNSLELKKLSTNTTVEILESDDFWARIQVQGLTGWVPLHLLKNRHDDSGVFVNLIETPLRSSANVSSAALTTLPRLHRFIPLEITKSFLKVRYQEKIGYADITHFVSRADFATLAYHPKKNWFSVLYRNNDILLGSKGELVPIKEIQGFVTPSAKGILVESGDINGPQIRSRVEILKPEAYSWGVSKLEGHGEVYWKRKNLLIEEPMTETKGVSTDELLKREIFSVALENKNSVRGLVSSEGVYRSEDGQVWKAIPLFGKKNYPVSIHPNGDWFVGPYRSKDAGKTFEPFIRWDKLAQAIQTTTGKTPKVLKLTQIDPLPSSQIQVQVDTGVGKVKLVAKIGDLQWHSVP